LDLMRTSAYSSGPMSHPIKMDQVDGAGVIVEHRQWPTLAAARAMSTTVGHASDRPTGPSKTQVRPSRGRLPSSCPAWSIRWSDRSTTIAMLVSTTGDSPSCQTPSPLALRAVMQPSRASCRSSLRRSMRAAVSTVTAATSAQYVAAGARRPPRPGHGGHQARVLILCHSKTVASWRTRPPRTQCGPRRSPAHGPPVPKIVERQLTALIAQGFHAGDMLING